MTMYTGRFTISLFLFFSISNTHLLPLHPLCAPCLVMRAPVTLGRSVSTMTQRLANALSSGTEAATAMPTTLQPWKHARESAGAW